MSASNGVLENVKRHPQFYFEDGNVIFLVEDTLFNVHRYFFFRDSAPFRAMFSLQPPPGTPVEGQSDEHPIQLLGTNVQDFERLLSVMYPAKLGVSPFSTTDEWKSILEMSTKYEFVEIREMAINTLSKTFMDPIDKISIAQQYDIRLDWVITSFIELCLREAPLTYEEGLKLGMKIVTKLASAREILRTSRDFSCHSCGNANLQLYCHICEDYSDLPFHLFATKDVEAVIRDLFGLTAPRPAPRYM